MGDRLCPTYAKLINSTDSVSLVFRLQTENLSNSILAISNPIRGVILAYLCNTSNLTGFRLGDSLSQQFRQEPYLYAVYGQ